MEFRLADSSDIDLILSLRMQMLQEVAETIPQNLAESILHYLKENIPNGRCLCVLGEHEHKIAAKAMLCVYDAMPDEINISGKYARLFSVYTLPEFRGQGCMEQLLGVLLQEAKNKGINEVFASAEKLAIPLYKRIGFAIAENEMNLKL